MVGARKMRERERERTWQKESMRIDMKICIALSYSMGETSGGIRGDRGRQEYGERTISPALCLHRLCHQLLELGIWDVDSGGLDVARRSGRLVGHISGMCRVRSRRVVV